MHDLLASIPVTSTADTSALQFFLNVPFEPYLDVYRNIQFPGQMAVTLQAELLPEFRGLEPVFPLYERSTIEASLKPKTFRIPPVYGTKPVVFSRREVASKLDKAHLDFSVLF